MWHTQHERNLGIPFVHALTYGLWAHPPFWILLSKVATALGDLQLAGKCRVNVAYNYIWLGQYDEAQRIIHAQVGQSPMNRLGGVFCTLPLHTPVRMLHPSRWPVKLWLQCCKGQNNLSPFAR